MDIPTNAGGSQSQPQTHRLALVVVTTIFFMWGFLTCLNDILSPYLKAIFQLSFAQANLIMEDQAQVLASPAATLVGVYDGHGGPDASRFLRSSLFPHVQRTPLFFPV